MTSTVHAAPSPKELKSAPDRRRPSAQRPYRAMGTPKSAIPYLAPAVIVVMVLLLIPFAWSIWRSFMGTGASGFVGFDNYTKMFQDDALQRSLLNTFIWAVGSLVLPVGMGLAIAAMTVEMRLGAWARAAVVIPCALSGTVVATIGSFLFASDGSVNQILHFFGVLPPGEQIGWLLYWPLNILAALFVGSWAGTGVNVVLFLVGLQTVPRETLEAAQLDGAGGWTRFWRITFPQLKATTAIVVGLTITNALRGFDLIWVLTAGGPNRSSETLALSMYRESFLMLNPGVGSAIAVLLTMIVFACSWLYLRRQTQLEN